FPPGPRLPAEELTKLKDRASALFKEALGPDGIRERDATVRDRAAAILALKDLGPPRQIAYVGAVHKGNGNFIGTGNAGGKPRPIHILPRGDVTKPGKEVGPGAIAAIPGINGRFTLAPDHSEGDRRAALAQWLTDRSPGQRVLRLGEPFGECGPAIALGMIRCECESAVDAGNGRDGAGADFLPRLGDVAARQNVDRPRFAASVPRADEVPIALVDGADVGDLPGRAKVFQGEDRRRAIAHGCVALADSIWAERFLKERAGAVLELRQFLGGEPRAGRE